MNFYLFWRCLDFGIYMYVLDVVICTWIINICVSRYIQYRSCVFCSLWRSTQIRTSPNDAYKMLALMHKNNVKKISNYLCRKFYLSLDFASTHAVKQRRVWLLMVLRESRRCKTSYFCFCVCQCVLSFFSDITMLICGKLELIFRLIGK